jgi:hypothetical protein
MEIIDNFLSDVEFKHLSNIIMGQSFPWFYTENVSAPKGMFKPDGEYCKETDGFFNTIHNVFSMKEPSPAVQIFLPFFETLGNKFGYLPEDFYVLRLSMKFPKEGYTSEIYQLPHVDFTDKPHDTLIFYLNDSDGDTRLFDQYYDGSRPENFTVKHRVTPTKNRLLKFDGFQYHTAANPIETQRRVIVNLNMKPLRK